jgi:hypothetical protein
MERYQADATAYRCVWHPRLMITGTPIGTFGCSRFPCLLLLSVRFTSVATGGLNKPGKSEANQNRPGESPGQNDQPNEDRTEIGSTRKPPVGVPVIINLGLKPASAHRWHHLRSRHYGMARSQVMLPERSPSQHRPGHDCDGWLPRAEHSKANGKPPENPCNPNAC